jgi:acetyl-CoA synthetase
MRTTSSGDITGSIGAWLAAYRGSNICLADLLCDQHAIGARGATAALLYEDTAGRSSRLTYAELHEYSARFAAVLRRLGVAKGDRVATLLPKSRELMIATVALWRLGAVHVPLFTAFGRQAVSYRLDDSATRIVVTSVTCRDKIVRGTAARVVTVDGEQPAPTSEDVPFWSALRESSPLATATALSGNDPMILIYTSGTTGSAKGVPVPVKALASIQTYMEFGLDVRDDDIFWNIADPGWAYGLYYALVGPLLLGRSTIFYNGPFDPAQIYRVMVQHGVTNFAAAPTAYRALRAAERATPAPAGLRLRVASSAGEPLADDVIGWAAEHLGVPVYDQYGQTELGMVILNHHSPALQRPRRAGSVGHPMPGFRVALLDVDGRELGPDQDGEIAVDTEHSPLYWFSGYYADEERTAERFRHGPRHYLTGDLARRDADGYVYYRGRADDVITSAGYRIGPAEVETALGAHPAVAEAAAVGKPDELRGEIVKAFVVLRQGYAPSSELADEIAQHVKTGLAAHAYPRELEFVPSLPRTPSGKLQRFVLRAGAQAVTKR